MKRALLCISLVLLSVPAFAHKPSDSYLYLKIQGESIQGQWDIAIRDLDYAVGLDGDDDGLITWGELRARHAALAAYALSHLTVSADGRLCTSRPTEHLVDHHSDGAYAVLRFVAECTTAAPQTINVRYALFFDVDPLHRGLLRLQYLGHTHTAIFSPEGSIQDLQLGVANPWSRFLDYGREGIWHIWIGYDHTLFLLSLLLPAVLRRKAGHWEAVDGFRPAFWGAFKIVTAFTVAHSITLTLAALGIVSLPTRWVESAIAVSVVVVALNNLYPFLRVHLWWVAFAFGLVHGLGFASVLLDLGLPGGALLTGLVGFNLGVEVGQVAIVAVFLVPAFWVRHSWFYQRLVLGFGSLTIAAVASMWLLERSLNLDLLGF